MTGQPQDEGATLSSAGGPPVAWEQVETYVISQAIRNKLGRTTPVMRWKRPAGTRPAG